MNSSGIFWRALRSILYIFGAGLIIYTQLIPGKYLSNVYLFQNILFVWTAAFIHRRPGSTNDIAIFIVTLYYALNIGEAMALGTLMHLAMVYFIRKFRYFNVHQVFIIEWAITSLIYLCLLIITQLILSLFLLYHLGIVEIFYYFISFIVAYPLLNFLIIILVRSRKEEDEL